MTTAIAIKKEEFSLTPRNFQEAKEYSEYLAKTDFVPKAYQSKPGNILVAVQMGAEIGLKPLQALQNIAVINGKPSIYGDAALALVKAHPAFEDIKEYYEDATETAVCEIKRKGQSMHRTTFSRKDAEKAALWGKAGPWTQYPKRMKQMRARGFGVRDTFPDAIQGLILAEEAQDYPMEDVTPSVRNRVATPPKMDANYINELRESIKPTAKKTNFVDELNKPMDVEYSEVKGLDENAPLPWERLQDLIDDRQVSPVLVKKWVEHAGVEHISGLTVEEISKCIAYIEEKFPEGVM